MIIKGLMILLFFLGGLLVILRAPWTGTLFYVWVEYFAPQGQAYSLILGWQASLIVGAVTVLAWLVGGPRHLPSPTGLTLLLVLWMVWVSLTTFTSPILPDSAFIKWDRVIKTLGFALFMTALLRERVQMEAFLWASILSLGFIIIPGALKTVAGGGGGNTVIGYARGDMGESSTVAMVCVMLIPLLKYLLDHARLVPRAGTWGRCWRLYLTGMMICSVIALIGTHARTGLVAGAVTLVIFIWKAKRRLPLILGTVILIPLALAVAPDAWFERMGTITTYEEDSSAAGRIQSWLWAIDLAAGRPILGGGFRVFETHIVDLEKGHYLAAHSIYFEVLGEHGFVGLGIFLTLLAATYLKLTLIQRRCRRVPDMEWARDLAAMIQVALISYLVGGAFIAVAFQFIPYTLIALTVALDLCVRRTFAPQRGPARAPLPGPAALRSRPA